MLRSRMDMHPTLMHLLRNLVYIEACSGFSLCPKYNDTHTNHLADDLLCNHISSFLLKFLHALLAPGRVPAALLDLRPDRRMVWASPQGGLHFKHILTISWPSPHRNPMAGKYALPWIFMQFNNYTIAE